MFYTFIRDDDVSIEVFNCLDSEDERTSLGLLDLMKVLLTKKHGLKFLNESIIEQFKLGCDKSKFDIHRKRHSGEVEILQIGEHQLESGDQLFLVPSNSEPPEQEKVINAITNWLASI